MIKIIKHGNTFKKTPLKTFGCSCGCIFTDETNESIKCCPECGEEVKCNGYKDEADDKPIDLNTPEGRVRMSVLNAQSTDKSNATVYDYITEKDIPENDDKFERDYKVANNNTYHLSKVEYLRLKAFMEDHKHRGYRMGASGGGLTVSFSPNALGVGVSAKCGLCGGSVNITDYNQW